MHFTLRQLHELTVLHSVFLVELTRILAIFSFFILKLHKLLSAYIYEELGVLNFC